MIKNLTLLSRFYFVGLCCCKALTLKLGNSRKEATLQYFLCNENGSTVVILISPGWLRNDNNEKADNLPLTIIPR